MADAGICKVVAPADINGNALAQPGDPAARSLLMEIDPTVTPSQEQLDLKRDVERVEHALSSLLDRKVLSEATFRPFYVELVWLAQIGLVGVSASAGIARHALDGLRAELLDNHGGTVKNRHLIRLTVAAAKLGAVALIAYLALRSMIGGRGSTELLKTLDIDPATMSCFALLWLGAFVGVVLAYGARTTTLTLDDLIGVEPDHLWPSVRLLFAGTLTMILGLLLHLGVLEFKIGGLSSTAIGSKPIVAFVVGVLCGLSELALPAAVSRRLDGLLDLRK